MKIAGREETLVQARRAADARNVVAMRVCMGPRRLSLRRLGRSRPRRVLVFVARRRLREVVGVMVRVSWA